MIQTVLVVHLPRPWAVFHRRHMLTALSEALPEGVVMLCVDRPVTFDVTPWRNPRRFMHHIWRSSCVAESTKLRVATIRTLLHDVVLRHVPWMSRINAWLISVQLRKVIHSLAPEGARIVQWVYHPVQAWVRLAFPDALLVYECYDEYSFTPDGSALEDIWKLETELLSVADVTFATTNELLEKRRDLTRAIQLIPNGIPEFFLDEPTPLADPIDNIPHPRIGYVGTIRRPMNLSLLRAVFEKHPDWQLVLVGPIQKSVGIQAVSDLPNVHIVGTRSFESLPAIIRKLDVGLIPHKITPFTRVMRPLKLVEYLACGLPVVATRLPGLMGLSQFVFFCDDDVTSFSTAVETVLNRRGPDSRSNARDFAREFTWGMIATRDVLPALEEVLRAKATHRAISDYVK